MVNKRNRYEVLLTTLDSKAGGLPIKEGLMSSKKCPNCGLYNMESAIRCDCGYDFPSGQITESLLSNTEKKWKHSEFGIASFSISIVVSIVIFLMIYNSIFDVKGTVIALLFTLFMYLAALGLGIGGLIQKDRKKDFAILGIIFSIPLICLSGLLAVYISENLPM
jgi:hypothetical protein